MAENAFSLILMDHCRFQRIETRQPGQDSLAADFGEAANGEFWAVFIKPNRPVDIKLRDSERELLRDWLATDDIRYYEVSDAEHPSSEHGFFNTRLGKHLPVSS